MNAVETVERAQMAERPAIKVRHLDSLVAVVHDHRQMIVMEASDAQRVQSFLRLRAGIEHTDHR